MKEEFTKDEAERMRNGGVMPRVGFMVNMALTRRRRLGKMADALDCSLVSLVEEGVDLVLEKKLAMQYRDFQKG